MRPRASTAARFLARHGPRVALALATSVLCALAIEFALRAALPLGAIAYQIDRQALHTVIPGAAKVFIHSPENGGDWVTVRWNEAGLRGAPIAASKTRRRVIVYGDSFVAAEYTPFDETFTEQLALGIADPVEVWNAGVVGYGPGQVARRMRAQLPGLQADAVVVAITAANDFGDLMRNRLYAFDDTGRPQPRTPSVGPGMRALLEQSPLSRLALAGLARAVWHGVPTRIAELCGEAPPLVPVADALLRRAEHDYQIAVVHRDPVVRNLFSDPYDADVSLRPDSRSARAKRKLMRAAVEEIIEVARGAGLPLLFIAIPSPIDVEEDHYGLRIGSRFPAYRRSALTDAVVAAVVESSGRILDLYPIFRRNGSEFLYFRAGNDHWNSRGQTLAARHAASRVAELLQLRLRTHDQPGEASR